MNRLELTDDEVRTLAHILHDQGADSLSAKVNALLPLEPPCQVRTPLTRENILAWAVQYASDHPMMDTTVGCNVWFKPELVLAGVLFKHNLRTYCQYKSPELLEVVIDSIKIGVRGFKDYGLDELLDEVWSEISSYEFDDVEDLVAILGPDADVRCG